MADESKRSSATLSSAPISSCPTANTFHGDVPVRKLSTQGGRGQDGIRAAYIANQSGIDGSDKSGRLLRVMQPWPSSSEKRTMLEYEISQGVNRIADDHDQCQPREEPEFIQSCKGNEAHVSRPRDNFLGGATDEARWMQGVQQLQLLDILRQEQLSVQLDQHREKLREQILLNAIRRRYIEENFLDQKPLPPLKKNSRILAECHRLQTGNKSSLEVCQITNYSDNSAIPDRAGISDLLLHRSLAYSHLAPSIIQRPLSSFSAVATPGYASGARSSLRPYRMAFAQQVSDTAFLGARNGSEENPDNDLSLYSQDEVLAHNGLSSQRSTIVKETTRCKEDRGTPKKVQDSMIGRSSMFSDGDLHQQHDNQLKESICRSTNMRNKIRQKSTPKGRKAKQTAIVPTYKMEAANTATTLGSNVEEFSRPLSHGFTLNSPLLRLIEKYSAGGRKSAPFPLKLHAILATPQYHEILGWLPDGKSWKIFQSALFEKILVPRHFRHAKYASFMRQGKNERAAIH